MAAGTAAIEELKTAVRGEVIRPGDGGYDEARALWNAMIDRRPALIVRPAGASDVITAVNFARDEGLVLAVRGGGHNIRGTSMCDGGLTIDFSSMKAMRVDPDRRTVRAEPGVKWGEFDRETQAFGLATTGGTFTDTGIAGLTLGGGIGWLCGKYGLASDNLIAADIVTADGKLMTVSAQENSDLFWALRGGGGNLGVVTSFEYQLHPVGMLLGGLAIHPFPRAKEALKFFRDFSASIPDELTTGFGFLTGPDGQLACGIVVCYNGPIEEGENIIRPVREFGPPVADHISPMPYAAVQGMFDELAPPGRHYYVKSPWLREIADGAIFALEECFAKVSSPHSLIFIQHKSGVASHGPTDRTAFGHRDDPFSCVLLSAWTNPGDSAAHIEWTRYAANQLEPFGAGGDYLNDVGMETDDGAALIRASFGTNYDQLVQLKQKYDPTNLFRHNQNIAP